MLDPISKIEIVSADITKEETGAIVNAANSRLANGGGVARAIAVAAGPEFDKRCIEIGKNLGCPTGQAVITDSYDLPSDYVIHAVGPIYNEKSKTQKKELFDSYFNSLKVAASINLKSISFPAISCGIFGYPTEEAAEVAIKALISGVKTFPSLETVRICFLETEDLQGVFEKELAKYIPEVVSEEDSEDKEDVKSEEETKSEEELLSHYRKNILWSYLTDYQRDIVINPVVNGEKVTYPISINDLASLTITDQEQLTEWYHRGILAVRKSVGEPEFYGAGVITAFFLESLETEELAVIEEVLQDDLHSHKFLIALAMIMGSKANVTDNPEERHFFSDLAKDIIGSTRTTE